MINLQQIEIHLLMCLNRITFQLPSVYARFPAPFIQVYSMSTRLMTNTSAVRVQYECRKINAVLNTVHNAMQITFRAETEVHDENHRVLERKICEFFPVLESVNQPVDHTTSNESRLHRTPAQEVSGHMYVHVPVCLNVYSK